MDTTTIIQYVISILPTVFAIISMVCMVAKVLTKFEQLKNEVKESKEFEEMKKQFNIILHENYELKKQTKQLLEKIDKVR